MDANQLEIDDTTCEFDQVLNLTSPEQASKYVVAISEQLGIIVGMLVVLTFGLPGNFAFLYVVYKLPHMRTITNFFLVNLAVADILFLVVTVFMYVIFLGASPVRSDYNVASLFSCVGVFVVPHITYFMSICAVTVVSIERFYAICYPIQHRAMNTKTRAVRLFLVSLAVAAILTAVVMPKYGKLDKSCIIWPDEDKYNELPQTLGFCRPVVSWWVVVGELVTVSPFLITMPCNLFMYIRIVNALSSRSVYKTEGQHRLPPQALQIRNQVARMLIINGTVFFLCQATNQFVTAVYTVSFLTGVSINETYDRLAVVIDIGRIAVFVNSAVNPLIYTASSHYYRTAFKQAFGFSSNKPRQTRDTPARIPTRSTPGSTTPSTGQDMLAASSHQVDEVQTSPSNDHVKDGARFGQHDNEANLGIDNQSFQVSHLHEVALEEAGHRVPSVIQTTQTETQLETKEGNSEDETATSPQKQN